ncbi:MAG: PhoU domain-containing protein, partial [Anaerolineales bacterium]
VRPTLDRKIQHLLEEILILDSMVEQATTEAVEALKRRDVREARRVYQGDAEINAKRFHLENETLTTIATQQPIMAGDLRTLASIFLGGTSVFGGVGTILGSFIGAFMIGAIEAATVAIGWTGFLTQLIYGLIIVLSVVMHTYLGKRLS